MIAAKKILVKKMVAKKSFLEEPSYSVLYRYIADSIFKLENETPIPVIDKKRANKPKSSGDRYLVKIGIKTIDPRRPSICGAEYSTVLELIDFR